MKKKTYGIAALSLVLAVALLLGIYYFTRPAVSQGQKQFTVTVVHGDGSTKDFSYQTSEEYLGPVLEEAGLIQGDPGDYGLYINTVDGETADYDQNQSYWAVYIGEEYAQQSIDQTPVHDGDTFRLVYTVYTEE